MRSGVPVIVPQEYVAYKRIDRIVDELKKKKMQFFREIDVCGWGGGSR